MRTLMMLTATLGLLSVAAPSAYAQHLDAKGKCHSADGKFAKADVCKAIAGAYKLDAKGKCHGPDGKFAKAEMCKPH